MNIIIIGYDGKFPSEEEFKQMLDDNSFIDNALICKAINEDSLIRLLVESSGIQQPTPKHTIGDDAVITLAGLTEMKTDSDLVVSLFYTLKKNPNPAVEKACKVLAGDAEVSRGVARKYGFTENKRSIIKKFING